jgi:hypothetical protein
MVSRACLLSAVTPFAYTASVMFGDCVVFTDAPEDCSKVARVLRKLCQPIRFVILTLSAAGMMCRLSTASGQ